MAQLASDTVISKEACSKSISGVRDTLYVVGGKWKLPIVSALVEGPLRFGELQKVLEDITPKVLSKELKELEINLLINREVQDTKPVTVAYSVTEYGKSVLPVTETLVQWGLNHRERIISNR